MNIHIFLKTLLVCICLAMVFIPSIKAQAQGTFGFQDGFDYVDKLRGDAKVYDYGSNPTALVLRILRIVLTLIGIITVGVVIYAGVMYITDLGKEDRSERAKTILLYAVIGLIVIGVSGVVVNVVINQIVK